MLGKLLKFEMKASARTLLPLYIGTLLAALVCGIFTATQIRQTNEIQQAVIDGTSITLTGSTVSNLDTALGFTMILVFAFCVAVTVLTIMSVVQRFNNGIAGNEGYLMFTLPVKHETLLASKLLGALLWTLASIVVIFLVGVIIGGAAVLAESELVNWTYFWGEVWDYFHYYNPIPSVLLTIVNGALSIVSAILTIYLAIMIGQMEQFNKYRVAVAVVAFFVLNWLFGLVENVVFGLFGLNLMAEPVSRVMDVYSHYNLLVGCDLLLTVLQCVAVFFATVWMMKKKLNL